jgi:hypothetical protein
MTAKFEDERHIHEHDWQAPPDDPQDQAIRKLAVCLIEQARDEVRGCVLGLGPLKYPGERRTRAVTQQEARDFLTGATPAWRGMLDEWCEVIDLDPALVIADAQAGCLTPILGSTRRRRPSNRGDVRAGYSAPVALAMAARSWARKSGCTRADVVSARWQHASRSGAASRSCFVSVL